MDKYIGKIYESKYEKCKVIIVNKDEKIGYYIAKFLDEFGAVCKFKLCHMKDGSFKNPYYKSVYSIGYVGQGLYSRKSHLKEYKLWQHMMERCYDGIIGEKYPTYSACTTSDE